MSYYSRELGLGTSERETGETPAVFNDGDDVEYSRRTAPELHYNRQMVRQENVKSWQNLLDNSEIDDTSRLVMDIVLTGQKGQDGILAALTDGDAAHIASNSTVEVIKLRMRSSRWDAYDPVVTATEAMRESHMREMLSRARMNPYNERAMQGNPTITHVEKHEEIPRPAGKKWLGVFRR